jgi:hypothetical protein
MKLALGSTSSRQVELAGRVGLEFGVGIGGEVVGGVIVVAFVCVFRKEEAAFTPCFRRLLGLFGRFWTPILDPFWTPILGVNFDIFWAL